MADPPNPARVSLSSVVGWSEFALLEPELAAAGRGLLYQYGVGLGFLATVRRDGAPRVHPVCPIISDDGLFVFVVPSPKLGDLRRDGRFALHSFAAEDNEDAFSVAGVAHACSEDTVRRRVLEHFAGERGELPAGVDSQELFEFTFDRVLLTRTTGHGDPSPEHTVWRESSTPDSAT